MRIAIDMTRCTGHGICEGIAEDIFEVVDDGYARLLLESPDDSRKPDVERAVRSCPTRAISIENAP